VASGDPDLEAAFPSETALEPATIGEDVTDEIKRKRLKATMDEWLAALEAHEPGRLRLAPDFRYTEHGQTIALGTGTWRTFRGREPGGHWYADSERGTIEFWGVFDEMGRRAMAAIRLRTSGRTILEAETIVTRQGAFFDPNEVLAEAPQFHVAVASPASREALIAAVHCYFDAIERSEGAMVSVRDDCRRLVNGVVDSSDDPSHVEQGEEHRALSVSQQITDGHYAYIEALRDRRFPIVDVARGLVVCHLVFDHPGDLPRAGGDLIIRSPGSMIFTEVFKLSDGRIDEIWALGSGTLPYGSRSGW
jgi:hypothetical protein